MRYKGKFKPKNPTKYKGDLKEIVYRSSWELKMISLVMFHRGNIKVKVRNQCYTKKI